MKLPFIWLACGSHANVYSPGLQLDVEALLALVSDLGRDVDAAGPVRWKLWADDWSFTTSV